MTEDLTLPDFQAVPNTTNSGRNMCLVARTHMTNENNLCSKHVSKYQTCLASDDWMRS